MRTMSMKAPLLAVAISLFAGCATWDKLTTSDGADVSAAGRTTRPAGPELPAEPPPEIDLGRDPAAAPARGTSSDKALATEIRHQQMEVVNDLRSAPPRGAGSPGRVRDRGLVVVLGGGKPNPWYREEVLEEDGKPAVDAEGKPLSEYPYFMAFQLLSTRPQRDMRDAWSMSVEDAAEDIHHLGDLDDNGQPMVSLVKASIPEEMVPPELRQSAGVYGADTWWIVPVTKWQKEQVDLGNFQRLSLVNDEGVHLPVTRLTGRAGSRAAFMNFTDEVLGVDIFNPDGIAAGDATHETKGPWNIAIYNPNIETHEFRGVMPDDEETSD